MSKNPSKAKKADQAAKQEPRGPLVITVKPVKTSRKTKVKAAPAHTTDRLHALGFTVEDNPEPVSTINHLPEGTRLDFPNTEDVSRAKVAVNTRFVKPVFATVKRMAKEADTSIARWIERIVVAHITSTEVAK